MERLPFKHVWLVDFEFIYPDGEPLERVVCMVAADLVTGRRFRIWDDDLTDCPFDTGPDSLFIAYAAHAEMHCFLALDWPLPERVIDLFAEFRNLTNDLPHKNLWKSKNFPSQIGAMRWYGLPTMDNEHKQDMRELIMSGGPWSLPERKAILEYCEEDVLAMELLFPCMLPHILAVSEDPMQSLGWALMRGRYSKALAHIETNGVPIDVELWQRTQLHWDTVRGNLIDTADRHYGVYEGESFRTHLFQDYLARSSIPWPRLPSGNLDLNIKTFREMARAHPKVALLYELRKTLSKFNLNNLQIGRDGRNRVSLMPYGAITGRNQPSNAKNIFGPARWIRGFIRPAPGHGLAYIDWASQEVGIAAALSGDANMMAAYESPDDVYLAFAKQAGLAPPHATKKSHPRQRNQCKAIVLGVQFGMSAFGIAHRLNMPVIAAEKLLEKHQQIYPQFWEWRQNVIDHAAVYGKVQTVFGWQRHANTDFNDKSVANHPIQGGGNEMLRLACCMLTEAGIKVCAPIHDAVLIEAPLSTLDETVTQAEFIMEEASRIVLGGFTIKSDTENGKHVYEYPNRYMDGSGLAMWKVVMGELEKAQFEVTSEQEMAPDSGAEIETNDGLKCAKSG